MKIYHKTILWILIGGYIVMCRPKSMSDKDSSKSTLVHIKQNIQPSTVAITLDDSLNGKIQLEGSKNKLKSDLFWLTDTISVCWLNATQENIRERQWVREAISKTWENSSSLRFVNWEFCKPFKNNGGNGVRIQIQDTQPVITKIGKDTDKEKVGLTLNFTFNDTPIPVIVNETELSKLGMTIKNSIINETVRKKFIEAQAVHEFGHVIGFSHQQNRSNCDFNCIYEPIKTTTEAIYYTPCDENSVMNYCNSSYLNGGNLSLFDIETLQKFYPPLFVQPDTISVSYSVLQDTLEAKIKKNNQRNFQTQNKQQQQQNNPNQNDSQKFQIWASKVNIFISAKKSIMDKIVSVRYRLHQSTFHDMTSKDKKNRFPIALLRVWGNFVCQPEITFKDGSSITLPGKRIEVRNTTTTILHDNSVEVKSDNGGKAEQLRRRRN